MVNWDKIKEEKHESILIGRCQNQALELMKSNNFSDNGVQEAYKTLVKVLYRLNLQIEAELLNPQKFSEKQKLCPKCNMKIPATWQRHDACGWKG